MQSATSQTYYMALEIDMVCKSITQDQDSAAMGRGSQLRRLRRPSLSGGAWGPGTPK